jgi:hypothetical protein
MVSFDLLVELKKLLRFLPLSLQELKSFLPRLLLVASHSQLRYGQILFVSVFQQMSWQIDGELYPQDICNLRPT